MKKLLLGMAGALGVLAIAAAPAGAMMMKTDAHAGWMTAKWDYRGGGCWINYTESGAKGWHYKTVTACNNAWHNIGGLTKGHWYKYTVTQDGVHWSRVMKVRAK